MRFADGARGAHLAAALLLAACGGAGGDLFPSGADRRPPVVPGSVGPSASQTAPDFELPDTAGGTVKLYDTLATSRGAVLYFTMWCLLCTNHMDMLRRHVIPDYPDVRFFAVDYISGSPEVARAYQLKEGFYGSPFTVLVDAGSIWTDYYSAEMQVVIVDRNRIVRWNGELKDVDVPRVRAILSSLQ